MYSAEGDNDRRGFWWGGLPEGIMRYYLGRDYQVDLSTTGWPHDKLGRLNAIELRWFDSGCSSLAAQQQYPMFHFLSFYSLSQVCAN